MNPGSIVLAQAQVVSSNPGTFQFPPEASTVAANIDYIYNFIMGVSIFFAVAIFAVLFLFLWKYNARRHPVAVKTTTHNTPLELTWSILPAFVLAYMFWVGFEGYVDLRTPPADAWEVKITAQKWAWSFEYSNGAVSDELHLLKDRPAVMTMTSTDVLHSFFVPAFRTKQDVVPGRWTKTWFTPTMAGEYAAFCAEYCGTKHSNMLARVVVHETEEDWNRWLTDAADVLKPFREGKETLADAGARVFKNYGCAACHTVDGSPGAGIAPTFQGLLGRTEQLDDGSAVTADEAYIRESIVSPMAKRVAGFTPAMPQNFDRIPADQLDALVEYLKSL